MFQIIGIVLLFGLVFGSFIMSGGNMGVIIEAAAARADGHPGGAGVAAFLIANSMTVIKAHRRRPGQGVQGAEVEGAATTATCWRCSSC